MSGLHIPLEVSQFTLNPLDRQLWLCEFSTTFNQDPKCAAVVLWGDPLFLWFAKGMKELQGEAEGCKSPNRDLHSINSLSGIPARVA